MTALANLQPDLLAYDDKNVDTVSCGLLVLPTTSLLRLNAPVAADAARAAGIELQKSLNLFLEGNGALAEAAGVVVPSFKLGDNGGPAFVYALVLPSCAISGEPSHEELSLLRRGLMGCLYAAQARGLSKLAMPVMAGAHCGAFGYPVEAFAQCLAHVLQFFSHEFEYPVPATMSKSTASLQGPVLNTVILFGPDAERVRNLVRPMPVA